MKKLFLLLFAVPLFTFSQQETKREYYASGKLLSIINYNVGVREGSCKYFYDYGAWAILSESNYKKGKLSRESIIIDGVEKMKFYDKDGNEIYMPEGKC